MCDSCGSSPKREELTFDLFKRIYPNYTECKVTTQGVGTLSFTRVEFHTAK